MTGGETLRRAASLMRERAEAARAGRWYVEGSQVRADWADEPRIVATCHGSFNEGNTVNAEHIASWGPAVALAVADLLDDEALTYDIRRTRIVAAFGEDAADDFMPEAPHLLAVARAYLGEEPS